MHYIICNANESKFFLQPNLSAYRNNFDRMFMSFTFLITIALIAPHHSESAVVYQNSCNYSVIKFLDFFEVLILFIMESVD